MDIRRLALYICVCATAVASMVRVSTAPEAAEAHSAFDGVWHAATYLALTLVALYASDGREEAALVVAGVVVLGGATEAAQSLVAYRTASVGDAAANWVGVAVGCLVVFARRRLTI